MYPLRNDLTSKFHNLKGTSIYQHHQHLFKKSHSGSLNINWSTFSLNRFILNEIRKEMRLLFLIFVIAWFHPSVYSGKMFIADIPAVVIDNNSTLSITWTVYKAQYSLQRG